MESRMGLSAFLASARASGPQVRHRTGLSLWERRKGLVAVFKLIVPFQRLCGPRGARKDASRRPASVMFLGRGYLHRNGAPAKPLGEAAMKVTVEMDMTPQEARAFMGLPDVEPMQKKMLDDMQ